MENFGRFLRKLQGRSSASCFEAGDARCSYSDLLQQIDIWNGHLDRMNVLPGTVVGLQADYSVHAAASLLALCARRATVALIPDDRRLSCYLADACASVFIRLRLDGSHEWIRTDYAPRHPLLEQLQEAGESGLVIFTSGSTGRPKAALHSIDTFVAKFCRPCRTFRTLAFLLFDHVAGVDTLFYTLASGGALICTARRDPYAVLELIESRQVEVLPTSPSFLRMMCASRLVEKFDVSSLKIITYGSEPMDRATLARLNELFPRVQISQKYGSTEMGSPRSVSRGNDSLWLRLKKDALEAKVIDGVLWLRGAATILGYLNAPSPFDEEGWYCTGDLVEVDGEWVRFLGRASEIINVGGQKVVPAEVEQAILELNFVRDSVVNGEPHLLLGHVVRASVVLADVQIDRKKAINLIQAHCRSRLAAYKVPVKIIITAELPMTGRQKVQRNPRFDA